MPRDLNLLTLPLRARLVSDEERAALDQRRYEARARYRPHRGFLLDRPVRSQQPRLVVVR
jgi:hypothetical protein